MYAQLGDIRFDLITYWEGLNAAWRTQYVEHAVIEGKPILQWIGDNLEEITIKLQFHADFCVPKEELQRLKEAMLKHEALDFVFGNGEYKGKFVIEEITSEVIQTFKDSEIVAIEAELKLKEWVQPKAIGVAKPTSKQATKKAIPKKEGFKVESVKNKDNVEFRKIVRQ